MIDPFTPDYSNTPSSPTRAAYDYEPVDSLSYPAVTIVTPYYNTGAVFRETACSIFRQSFQQWEWVIVNDGTTDPDALAVLQEYRHLDSRIRVIDHSSNKGLSAARNTGYRAARTPYVLQLDSDDLVEPTALEKWLWFLESFPAYGFVKGYSVGFGAQEYLWQKGFHDRELFLEQNLIDPTCLVRHTVHRNAGEYDEAIRAGLEDWDFWLRCANAGHWGATVPEYLDWYRRRPMHSERWTNWDDGRREKAFKETLRCQYPRLWKEGFPRQRPQKTSPFEILLSPAPFDNRLEKRKPRLLLIAPWLTLGGADQFNFQMIEQLVHSEWEVTIATTLTGNHVRYPEFAACTPDIFILHHFLHPTRYPQFLLYLIRSRQPDVVMISHSELGYDLLPYLRQQCPDPAYVDFCHIKEEYWRNGGYPRMAVDKQQSLDLHIVSSEHLKQWMASLGDSPERVRVCHTNAKPVPRADLEHRAAIRRQLDLTDSTPVILYAGRICPQKQPHVLAATLLKLAETRSDFVAIVAGDGPELAWLRSFVQRQGLTSRVLMIGAVSHARVRELMLMSDVFFLPSAWEGIALVLYEAMACGLPVVGADVGGQRELVTPECGVLIPRGTQHSEAEHYAKVLDYLLEHPNLRRQMGESGREHVERHFRLDQMCDRMEHCLREARQMRVSHPRPVLSAAASNNCALQVLKSLRMHAVSDQLWWKYQQRRPLRVQTFFVLRHLLLPVYRKLLERDVQWVSPLKNRLKVALLGWAES